MPHLPRISVRGAEWAPQLTTQVSSRLTFPTWCGLSPLSCRGFVSWSALGGFVQYLAGRASDVCCFYVCIFPVVSISLNFEKT